MVSVRNVEILHLLKGFHQHADFRIAVNHPNRMPDAVLGNEIVNRLYCRCPAVDNRLCVLVFLVGKENRACVCVQRIHMADTVSLLVCACQLMLFNRPVNIFVHGRTANQTRLASAVHRHAVKIQVGQQILSQNPVVNHVFKVFLCLCVNRRAVNVNILRQVHLCLVNMQEGPGLSLHHFSCFFAVHYVIGQGSYVLCVSLCRADRHKGSDGCHNFPPLELLFSVS